MQRYIVGNWKMNGLLSDLEEIKYLAEGIQKKPVDYSCVICPPATLLCRFLDNFAGGLIGYGAQDCHYEVSGAYTGNISAQMIAELGGQYVILGHSERRILHAENNALICKKASAALGVGLTPIICIGEDFGQRERGETFAVLSQQIKESIPKEADNIQIIIAYEPFWAIGTGVAASVQDILEAHAHIRSELGNYLKHAHAIPILYGGSVKPDNAGEILALENIDGALVGGASLKAKDFLKILQAG